MRIKKLSALALALAGFALILPAWASAHVVVTPNQVGIGASQTFNISVPNEKASPITQVKLDLPSGVQGLTPTAKTGWDITLDKTGSGDSTIVKSITWTGSIPVGFRDDFSFSVQAPAKTTQLNWKAYQSYADGSTVHWDQKPAATDDATGDSGPYSVTKVVDDLAVSKTTTPGSKTGSSMLTLLVATTAIIASAVAIVRSGKNSEQQDN